MMASGLSLATRSSKSKLRVQDVPGVDGPESHVGELCMGLAAPVAKTLESRGGGRPLAFVGRRPRCWNDMSVRRSSNFEILN